MIHKDDGVFLFVYSMEFKCLNAFQDTNLGLFLFDTHRISTLYHMDEILK